MRGTKLALNSMWTIGERLGGGGFGEVWEASSSSVAGAAKFIPKAPGADRELLFVDLGDARNIVPIIDSGETDQHWVLVMPRAELSLRQYLDSTEESPDVEAVLPILRDICGSLSDLEVRQVVHPRS